MENKKTTFDEINKEGRNHYENGEYDEALKKFQEALKSLPKKRTCPKKRKALFNIGTTYYESSIGYSSLNKKRKKFRKKALAAFEEALNNPAEGIENPVYDYHIHYNMGLVYQKLKSYQKAIKSFDNARNDIERDDRKNKNLSDISSAKALSTIYSAKGITYFKMGEYNKSEESFNKAINVTKNHDINKKLFSEICLTELYFSLNNLKKVKNHLDEIKLQINKFKKRNKEKEDTTIKELNKNQMYVKEIEGKIEIRKKNYSDASKCFIEALEFDLDEYKYLLFEVYADYLSTIYKKQEDKISDDKKQEDKISEDKKQEDKISEDKKQEDKISEDKISEDKKQEDKISDNDLFTIIEKLENICNHCIRKKDYKTKKIVLYYLGYFYARSQDYIAAIDNLKQCIHIDYSNQSSSKNIQHFFKSFFCGQSRMTVQEHARELLKNIYQRAYKPSLCDWWWNSPINKNRKKIGFCIIIGMIFLTIAFLTIYPFYLSNDVNTLMAEIEPLQNKNLSLEEKKLALEERNYQIEQIWVPYNALKSFSPFLIGSLLLILLFPKIESFKAGGIELQLSKTPGPPEILFSPFSMMKIMEMVVDKNDGNGS